MEQETIRARRIELYNDRGENTVALEGGGDGAHPGIVVVGPTGADGTPSTSVTLILREDTNSPYFLLSGGGGAAVVVSFDDDGQPMLTLRKDDGTERAIEP